MLKRTTRDKQLQFRYGIYGGLALFSLQFIFVLILGLTARVINLDWLLQILILFVVNCILWFFIGFKTLDKVRSVCNKYNLFRVLFVMWGVIFSLSVLITVIANLFNGESFHSNVGGAGGILFLFVIEYFYKRSRKKKL